MAPAAAAAVTLKAEVTTKADQSSTYTMVEVDNHLATLEGRVASAQRVADVEATLEEKADRSTVDDLTADVNRKANAADVYTQAQVDSAIGNVQSDVHALSSAVNTKAGVDEVQGLADAVNGRIDEVDGRKADKSGVYMKGEVDGLLDSLELDPATSANSPDCVAEEVR